MADNNRRKKIGRLRQILLHSLGANAKYKSLIFDQKLVCVCGGGKCTMICKNIALCLEADY
jgi:hypothetical protein